MSFKGGHLMIKATYFSKTTKILATATLAILSSLSAHASEKSLPIVGGQVVTSTDQIAKSTVALLLFSKEGAALCTGSIMDTSHILTAAHCVEGATKGIVIFALSLPADGTSPKKEDMRTVTHMVDSADFPGAANINSVPEFHDLAILTFEGGMPAGYVPAKYLTQAQYDQAVKLNANVTVAGYGTINAEHTGEGTLRKTNLKIKQISPKGMAVLVAGTNTDACSGDSGGPAFVNVSGSLRLFGVLSRGDKQCAKYAIYTKFVQGQDVNGESAVAAR